MLFFMGGQSDAASHVMAVGFLVAAGTYVAELLAITEAGLLDDMRRCDLARGSTGAPEVQIDRSDANWSSLTRYPGTGSSLMPIPHMSANRE